MLSVMKGIKGARDETSIRRTWNRVFRARLVFAIPNSPFKVLR